MQRGNAAGHGVHGVHGVDRVHGVHRVSRSASIESLESRRHLTVAAHMRVLGKETTIHVGQSVHVSAVTSGSGKQTDVGVGSVITAKFEWNFGDTSPTSKYNSLPGFNAAHVYDTPGTYPLLLRVTNEAGETDAQRKMITVLPDNRRPIYLSAWGKDNNSGLTKNKAVRTIGRAMQLFGDNSKLLFRRGETFKIAYP